MRVTLTLTKRSIPQRF